MDNENKYLSCSMSVISMSIEEEVKMKAVHNVKVMMVIMVDDHSCILMENDIHWKSLKWRNNY